MTEISSDNSDPVTKPRSWDKALKAAGMRLLGATQSEAAKAADISERTLRKYEQCSWWAECERQARNEYLDEVRSYAYRSLLKLIRADEEHGEPDGKTVRWFLERAGGDEFLPPRQKVEQEVNADVTEHDGDTDEPDWSQLDDEDLDELERIRRKMNGSDSDTTGN